MPAAAAKRGALLVLKGFFSFRVLLALTTSASVTAAVAGPMAYQAAKARDVVVVAPATTTTTTTTTAPDEPVITIASTTTSTTSTTTTTTEAPVVPVATTTTIVGTTTTTTSPVTATGLLTSVSADHSRPSPLDGARIYGRAWLFFDGSGVRSVSYWLDDPAESSAPDRVAVGPFDLDPNGIDLTGLGLGTHTLVAEVTTLDGTYRRAATFQVTG